MINSNIMRAHMYDIIGAIHEVHKELGAGLNEACYQEAMQLELDELKILNDREMPFHPIFHGKTMASTFRVDFLCKHDIVVECKAVSELIADHRAQLFNYMRILKAPCGILVNFQPKFAVIERYLYDKDTNDILSITGKLFQRL